MTRDNSSDYNTRDDAIAFIDRVSPFIQYLHCDSELMTAYTEGEKDDYKYIRLTYDGEVVYEMNFKDKKEFNGYANIPMYMSRAKYTVKDGFLEGECKSRFCEGYFKKGKFSGKLRVEKFPGVEFDLNTHNARTCSEDPYDYYTYKDNILSGKSTGEYDGNWDEGKFTGKHYKEDFCWEDGPYSDGCIKGSAPDRYKLTSYEEIKDGEVIVQGSLEEMYRDVGSCSREIYMPLNGKCYVKDTEMYHRDKGKKLVGEFYRKNGKKEGPFFYQMDIDKVKYGHKCAKTSSTVEGTYVNGKIEGQVFHKYEDKIYRVDSYHGGYLHGQSIIYFSLRDDPQNTPCIRNYSKDALDGEQLYFYDNIEGPIRRKDYYITGKKVRSLEYTPNNILMKESRYENNKLSDEYVFASDGKTVVEHTLYKRGKKRLQIKYSQDGKQQIDIHHYNDEGKDDTRIYLAKKKIAAQHIEAEKREEARIAAETGRKVRVTHNTHSFKGKIRKMIDKVAYHI